MRSAVVSVLSVLIVTLSFKLLTQPVQSVPPAALVTQSVRSVPPAAVAVRTWAAKFFGEYLLSKGLDEVWDRATGKPDVKDLAARLRTYEAALSRVDENLARSVAQLRAELSTKVTKDEVHKIVQDTLKELETRIQKLEIRVDKLEDRVKELEELFGGYIPMVTPAPLLQPTAEGAEPKAHPLMGEWIKLLCKSEASRLKLAELRRERTDESRVVIEAVAADRSVLQETAALRQKVLAELAGQLPEREALLKEFKRSSSKVLDMDERLASLTWLAAVTKPIDTGEHKGRLGVPLDLLGPKASDIMRAFELVGVEFTTMIGLFRHVLAAEASEGRWLTDAEKAELSPTMTDLHGEAFKLHSVVWKSAVEAGRLEKRLQAALKEYSDAHPRVMALRKDKRALLDKVKSLHEEGGKLLNRGLEEYLRAMKTERPTNPRMTAFRLGVLAVVDGWVQTSNCIDWDDSRQATLTWQRVIEKAGRLFRGVLVGHKGGVESFAISPDGKTLVFGGEATIKIWDLETGKERRALDGHKGYVNCVAISPDSKTLVSGGGGRDGTIKLWDLQSGKELRSINGDNGYVSCGAISPDGKTLVFGGEATIKIWDLETGKERRTLDGHKGYIKCVAISPDSKTLVSGGDGTIKVWDLQTGKELRSLGGHKGGVSCVAISPHGKSLVSGGYDWKIRVWDLETGKERPFIGGHISYVGCVVISPDGKTLVSSGGDDHIMVWDLETGKRCRSLGGHKGNPTRLAISPDGGSLVSGYTDGAIGVWDLEDEKER